MSKTDLYRKVAKELKRCGYYYLKNGKGSHEKWAHEKTGQIINIPYNLKSRNTARTILKNIGSRLKV